MSPYRYRVAVAVALLSAFLRLRNIDNWVDDPRPLSPDPTVDRQLRDKINKEAQANVEELIRRVTAALQNYLKAPDRIAKLINDLTSDNPDERAYAFGE